MIVSKLHLFRGEIEVNGRKEIITVYHNLPSAHGLSIIDAVENWVIRTKKFTAKSLCKYVMSKDESFVCITEKRFNHLNKTGA